MRWGSIRTDTIPRELFIKAASVDVVPASVLPVICFAHEKCTRARPSQSKRNDWIRRWRGTSPKRGPVPSLDRLDYISPSADLAECLALLLTSDYAHRVRPDGVVAR